MTRRPHAQRGAALLAALLTVALVTTLAAGAMWQQWRLTEVESLTRERAQAQWLLTGALDWARVILREDARAAGNGAATDHLAEPWAVPLQEARLSDFLAAMPGASRSADDANLADGVLLSGRIVDAQSRFNLSNLIVDGKPDPQALRTATRLFGLLGLPPAELAALVQGLQAAASNTGRDAMPRQWMQLTWFGVSPQTLTALAHHATLLPGSTPINVNTASAEVLAASVPGLNLSQARQLVQERTRRDWKSLDEFNRSASSLVSASSHSVDSHFFEVWGQIRQRDQRLLEQSLVQRDGMNVTVLWRQAVDVRSPVATVFLRPASLQ